MKKTSTNKEYVYSLYKTYSLISICKNLKIKMTSFTKSAVPQVYFHNADYQDYDHQSYKDLNKLIVIKTELVNIAPVDIHVKVNDYLIEDLQEKSDILSNIKISEFKNSYSYKILSDNHVNSIINSGILLNSLNTNWDKISKKDMENMKKVAPHLFP